MIVRDTIRLNSQTYSPSMFFGGHQGYEFAAQLNAASGVDLLERPSWAVNNPLEEYVNAQRLDTQNTFSQLHQQRQNEDYNAQFKPLLDWDDFQNVPPAMQVALAMMPEIRDGIASGRFAGYGFDPSFYPEEDPFGRLIENGWGTLKKDGTYKAVSIYQSGDPNLTDENLEDLERSRNVLRELMLQDPDVDPTDPSQMIEGYY